MKDFKTKSYTGAFVLLDSLIQNGASSIFGYPGGAILPIYDELYSWEKHGLIKHYLVRHEQGAAHAADGYARCSGKVGVCFATSGPGATNLITGIATAQSDSIPMVVITGQVSTTFLGTDAFQEIDTFGITLSIVKHSYALKNTHYISEIVNEAFYIAQNGRPGPVLIDVPKDIGLSKIPFYVPINQSHTKKILVYHFYRSVSKYSVKQFIDLVKISSQPLFYVGGGVITANATQELLTLAEFLNIPITTTLMGKGCIDESHPLALGMLGMHGTAYANFATSNCDLLIAIGARFDDRVTGNLEKFACNAVVIHVDIDPAEIAKNRTPNLALVGDLKIILKKILNITYTSIKQKYYFLQIAPWITQIKKWKEIYPLRISNLVGFKTSLLPQEVLYEIGNLVPDAFFTTDVGQHQMWAAQFISCKPRRWLSSSGLGTMGYGLPAAIGAQVAFPEAKVVCISGDSSFQMNLQELGTIAQYRLPIKILVINNRWQGMVRQWQQSFYDERYSHSNMEKGAPDLYKLAEAYGIPTFRCQNRVFLQTELEQALKTDTPVLIDFWVVEDENCYPMIKPGQSNSEMLGLQKDIEREKKKRSKSIQRLADLINSQQ